MTQPLIAPTFLFHFSIPCRQVRTLWSDEALELPRGCRLFSFGRQLEKGREFAEVRLGWCDEGLAVSVRVSRKKQLPWCRAARVEDSDGLSLFVATRDTRGIHRAGRFCHRFVLLPGGGGHRMDQPVAELVPIHRAREEPKAIAPDLIRIRSQRRSDGYLLRAGIPAAALTGFNPAEHPRLGFSYLVADRELGWQTLSVGPEFPFMSDPSLWETLELSP